jgi:uncharacterized phage protein (TIGR01671 family)
MRDIRFRGKRIDNGEWVYGNYVNDNQGHFITLPLETAHRLVRVNPATVGQFTGLHDKNGKEIYEGDVVRHDNGWVSEIIFGNIGYDNSRCGLTGFGYETLYDAEFDFIELNYSDSPDDIEVIGNIHEKADMEV